LLLQHGQFYQPNALPPDLRLGAPQKCFHNAWWIALQDKRFRYAEGYVVGPTGFVFPHGFVVNAAGAFDCTFREPCVLYYGLEFDHLALVVGRETRAFCTVEDWFTDNAKALRRFNAAYHQPHRTWQNDRSVRSSLPVRGLHSKTE
jgi:hypothetical protein